MTDTKKITRLALLLTAGIVLNIVEIMLPPLPIPVPGIVIRLGLANIVTLILLYTDSAKDASIIHILRILLANLLSGRLFQLTFFNALLGGILALILMIIAKKSRIYSPVGVSVLGSCGHVVGQVISSAIILNMFKPFYFYLPILVLISIPTGIFTGLVTIKYLETTKEL